MRSSNHSPSALKPDSPGAAEGPLAIFASFLALGIRAFGGPVAQLADIEAEFITRRAWTTPERFRAALAVYQLLPGPEAHEMCCYLGAVRGGRLGSVAAGLGFMLPGLVLMLLACVAYSTIDLRDPPVAGAIAAMQLAASALIVRAAWRLGRPVLSEGGWRLALMLATAAAAAWWFAGSEGVCPASDGARGTVGNGALFAHGLTAGMVSFGGAYTAIPFVAGVASGVDGWMPRSEVLDGVAIATVLPAPLVIFATFVGWRGGGLGGALACTLGIFLPAFAFTLVGFGAIERLLAWRAARRMLDGGAAVAVGIIIGAAVHIVIEPLSGPTLGAYTVPFACILLAATVAMRFRWGAPVLVIAAGACGAVIGSALA